MPNIRARRNPETDLNYLIKLSAEARILCELRVRSNVIHLSELSYPRELGRDFAIATIIKNACTDWELDPSVVVVILGTEDRMAHTELIKFKLNNDNIVEIIMVPMQYHTMINLMDNLDDPLLHFPDYYEYRNAGHISGTVAHTGSMNLFGNAYDATATSNEEKLKTFVQSLQQDALITHPKNIQAMCAEILKELYPN